MVRNKSMGVRDRIPPDPANYRQKMHCTIHRRSLPELNTPARRKGSATDRSSFSQKKNPRTTTFKHEADEQPPTPHPLTNDGMVTNRNSFASSP
jgi:hypothetical protein